MNEELDKKLHYCMSEVWKAYRRGADFENSILRLKQDGIDDPDYSIVEPMIDFMAMGLTPALNRKRGLI